MERIGTRDWAHLHPELLEMIAVRLTEIVDRVCFSSVCPQWRSASKSVAHDLPPQLPWLLLPKDRPRQLFPWPKDRKYPGGIATARRFLSLSHNRTFAVHLPEHRRTGANKTFPSPCGRILTPQRIETLALLHPLTLSSVTLPLLPLTESMRRNNGAFALRNAKVFASNLVAVVFPHASDLLFCRQGDSSWKTLEAPCSDFVYYKGKLLVINSKTTSVFDVDTLQKISEIPSVGGAMVWNYLVESFAGNLLLIQRTEMCSTKRFRLFQLDESEEKAKWMEINSIGDNVLFVDGVQAMAFEATDSNGWRRNCIYFVVDGPFYPNNHVMVYNVGKGEIEELPLFTYASSEYWGKALWVVPTLC